MKFAICNEIFKDWPLEEAFRFAAQTGYEALEIAPFTLGKMVDQIGPAERANLRKLAAEAGIAISGIHWVLVGTEGLYLTHPDAATRARTARYFQDLIRFCADIGGKYIVVGSPKQRNLMDGVTKEQGCTWAAEVFRPAIKEAQDKGVVICLEPLAPTETNFINTASEAIQFTQQFNSPNFKIILDVKAMSSESEPIPQIIKKSWPHFAYFHANDSNLKGPGFGEVDFVPILSALKEVGYNGYVSVEVFKFEEGPEEIARRSLQTLKQANASLQG